MEKVIIRKCQKQDFNQLKKIYQQCQDYHVETGYDLEKVTDAPEIFIKYVEELISMENSLVLVAESDYDIVGYCLCKIEEKPPVYQNITIGEIDNLAVLEEYQRMGVGEKLFQEALKWFKERGIKRIELMATINNEKSNNFWQKMGFETFMRVMGREI